MPILVCDNYTEKFAGNVERVNAGPIICSFNSLESESSTFSIEFLFLLKNSNSDLFFIDYFWH